MAENILNSLPFSIDIFTIVWYNKYYNKKKGIIMNVKVIGDNNYLGDLQ